MPNKVEDISSIQEEGNVLENHQERISESLSSSDKPPVLQQSNPLAASYDSNSFEWSLKPIILWMSISGIRLNSTKSRINRAVFLAIGCLVLLVNFLTNGFSLYYFLSLLTGDYASRPAFGIAGNASGASLANMGMKHSFFVSLVLGDHLIFFIVSLTTWKKLWALMIEIQERMKLPGSFYRRCRYVSLIGLIFLLLVAYQPSSSITTQRFHHKIFWIRTDVAIVICLLIRFIGVSNLLSRSSLRWGTFRTCRPWAFWPCCALLSLQSRPSLTCWISEWRCSPVRITRPKN